MLALTKKSRTGILALISTLTGERVDAANSSRWYLSRRAMRRHFCRTDTMEHLTSRSPASLHLDVDRPDHLGPFLGFLGDQLAEVGRRAVSTMPPKLANRAFTFGSVSEALISLLSVSTISTGVRFGTPTP